MLWYVCRAREKGRRKRGSGITGPGRGLWVETWFPDWLDEKPVNRPTAWGQPRPSCSQRWLWNPTPQRKFFQVIYFKILQDLAILFGVAELFFEFCEGLSMLWWLHTFPWFQFHHVPAAILHVPLLPSLLQAPDSHVLWPLIDILGISCPKLRSWWDMRTPPFFPCWSLKPDKWDCLL